jgi:hypothetical protein
MLILGSSERIVAEEAGFLERWIATYIAELLDREAKGRPNEKEAIRTEIATVVPALWEQQLAREALTVRRSIDWKERRVEAADRSIAKLLREVLANPSDAAALAVGSEAEVMQWLVAAERLFIEYVFLNKEARGIAVARSSEQGIEILRAFRQNDKDADELRKAVALLLPNLEKIDGDDVETIERVAGKAIEGAISARLTIATSLSRKRKRAGCTRAPVDHRQATAERPAERVRPKK